MNQAARALSNLGPLRRHAAGALLAACAALAAGPPGAAAGGTIAWHACPPDQPPNLQCGELAVPLDYAHPGGAKIKLAFNRLPAGDRAHRIGSLVVNPGGPGGAGTEVVALQASGTRLWAPALQRRFDLIGMDPRGIGTSTPVRCDPALFNAAPSLFPRTAAEF